MIPQRRSALRAEVKARRISTVTNMLVDLVVAADRNGIGWEASLDRKSRPTALLAIITMTNRNADWFASADRGKLATAAGRRSPYHRSTPQSTV
jgi:hypothetical protein